MLLFVSIEIHVLAFWCFPVGISISLRVIEFFSKEIVEIILTLMFGKNKITCDVPITLIRINGILSLHRCALRMTTKLGNYWNSYQYRIHHHISYNFGKYCVLYTNTIVIRFWLIFEMRGNFSFFFFSFLFLVPTHNKQRFFIHFAFDILKI